MRGDTVPGSMVFEFFTPGIAQVLKLAGCEYLIYDMEHAGFSIAQLKEQCAYCRGIGVTPMVRVPRGEYHFLARAQQEHAPTLLPCPFHQPLEQVDTGHALLERLAQQARGPYHRHAVDVDQGAVVNDLAQVGVAAGLDQLVNIDHHVLMGLARMNETLDLAERILHLLHREREVVIGIERTTFDLGPTVLARQAVAGGSGRFLA